MIWNTKEKLRSTAAVSIRLVQQSSNFVPIDILPELKEMKSLVFEFPVANQEVGEHHCNKHRHSGHGSGAVLPQPDLLSRPRILFNPEIPSEVIQLMAFDRIQQLAESLSKDQENPDKSLDVAGEVSDLSKLFLTMSFDQLKLLKQKLTKLSGVKMEVAVNLFHDIAGIVGTNPALMLIKEDIENGNLKGQAAVDAIQTSFRSVKTPTEAMLLKLVELVKSLKSSNATELNNQDGHNLYRIGMIHLSKLLHRACVHPVRRANEFPHLIYGHFCSKDSPVITEEWIPFLVSGIQRGNGEANSTEAHTRLVTIAALGLLGHVKGLPHLSKAIEGEVSDSPLVRSSAVHALKPMTVLNPELLKPVIFSIVDNSAENNEVRMAALAVMPWCQPSEAQLQNLATRTWHEPSKQVRSFIHSTLKSLSTTEVPQLKAVGVKALAVLPLLKPEQYGILFSHNYHFGKYVNYLKSSVTNDISWHFSSKFPSVIKFSSKFFSPVSTFSGLSFDVYSQGMDDLLDWLLISGEAQDESNSISNNNNNNIGQLLQKIDQDLKIKKLPKLPKELLIHSSFADFEFFHSFRANDFGRKFLDRLKQGIDLRYIRGVEVFNSYHVEPTIAGFVRFTETEMPLVYSLKGWHQYL